MLLLSGSVLAANPPEPYSFKLAHVKLIPGGFFEAIGMVRSATTVDSINTHFGVIPLGPSTVDALGTVRHSRMYLMGQLPDMGPIHARLYAEADFLNFTAPQAPFRWRQYWGEVKIGSWELLGGQSWSLVRPNRVGISSERDMMNTDVIDPEYHVGLLGARRRQVRLARSFRQGKVAIAWQEGGIVVAKYAGDGARLHWELGGLVGRNSRSGVMAAAVYKFDRLRIVTQQYWSKRDAAEAMSVVPAGVNGMATIEGIEIPVRAKYEVYSYAGLVYAARSAGNRIVREATIGANRTFGKLLASIQLSVMDRSIWPGRSGSMSYVTFRIRYTVN